MCKYTHKNYYNRWQIWYDSFLVLFILHHVQMWSNACVNIYISNIDDKFDMNSLLALLIS